MAQSDYFLKIDGIDGESKDAKHPGEIEVLSFNFGAQNTGGSSYGSGAGTGKVEVHDFSFTMRVCKATPKLIQACCGGDHIKSATFIARKAGKDQQEYLKYKFTDLLISHYSTSGSGHNDPVPTESCSFNFSKVEIEYKEQKEDGTLGGAVNAGWDLKKNQKV